MPDESTPQKRISATNIMFQWAFKLLAVFIVWRFFWTLTGLFLGILPTFADSADLNHDTYATLPTVVVGATWYLRAYYRRKPSWQLLGKPPGDWLLFRYFGFQSDFHVSPWLYWILAFALADKLVAKEWAAASVALFALLGFYWHERSSKTTTGEGPIAA